MAAPTDLKDAVKRFICSVLGPAGALVGPAIATGIAFAGSQVTGDYKELAVAAGSAVSGIVGNLSATAIQDVLDNLRGDKSNGHLERATAIAIQAALRKAREHFNGTYDADIRAWFDLWDRRLSSADPSSLFLDTTGSDVIELAKDNSTTWWPAFAQTLLRWAEEQQRAENAATPGPTALPENLAAYLRENLQTLTSEAIHLTLRDPKHEPEWKAWQQQFLEHLVHAVDTQSEATQRIWDRVRPKELPLETPSAKAEALRQSIQRAKGERSDLPLLSPWSDIVPYQGRDGILAQHLQWIANPAPPVSVRTIYGPAGAGKTRFAVELLRRLEQQNPQQWFGGFLRPSALTNDFEIQRPTVVVFDYASTSADALRRWLEAIAAAPPKHPLRILLLDRTASASEGWLASLTRDKWSNPEIALIFDEPEPLPLPAVDEAQQRWTIVDATLREACRLRRLPEVAVPALGTNPEFDQRLTDRKDIREPLHLQMAALASLDGVGQVHLPRLLESLALSRTDLAMQLAQRETARLSRFGGKAGERLRVHMAAYSSLCGGVAPAEIITTIQAEANTIGVNYAAHDCATELADALGAVDGIPPLTPDIVGEAFVLNAFSGRHRTAGDALVERLSERGIPALIRMAQDFSVEHVLGGTPSTPLDWIALLVEKGKSDGTDLLIALEGALPYDTLVLRDLAVKIDAAIHERLSAQEDLPRRAMYANNLSVRLSAVGRPEDAFRAAEEAVSLNRQLAASRPDAFLPDLAGSLNNMATILSAVGRREDALRAAEGAVSLRRQLAASRPDAFLPDLAMSLNTMANMLSDVGRREDALRAAEEAVSLRRQLAASRPDAFLPDLAASLNNAANSLSAIGRSEDALHTAEEAVSLYRQLAASRPDAFLPDLAGSLNNVANRLSDVGHSEEALRAAEEAVSLFRQLAVSRHYAFLPDLAGSLNNVAALLSAVGRREDALRAAEETVSLYRQHPASRPDAFLPDVARSLAVLSQCRSELDMHADAHTAILEGVTILAPYFFKLPQALSPQMAWMLDLYLQACQAAQIPPNQSLLNQIQPHFQP